MLFMFSVLGQSIWNLYNPWTFVCMLYVVNITFKHPRSYCDGVCLKQWYFDQCAATLECHATDTGHDIPSHHRIDTEPTCGGISIDMESDTRSHICCFPIFGLTQSRYFFPNNHDSECSTFNSVMVAFSKKVGRNFIVPSRVATFGHVVC